MILQIKQIAFLSFPSTSDTISITIETKWNKESLLTLAIIPEIKMQLTPSLRFLSAYRRIGMTPYRLD